MPPYDAPPFPHFFDARAFWVGQRTEGFLPLNPLSVALPLMLSLWRLDYGLFWQELAITGLDWLFTPSHRLEEHLHVAPLQASTKNELRFTLLTASSTGFQSDPCDLWHVNTTSLASCGKSVSLRIPSEKGYSCHIDKLPGPLFKTNTIVVRFQNLFTPCQGFFSAFHHCTVLYRTQHIFRVGSWCLPSSRTISKVRYSRTIQTDTISLTGLSPCIAFLSRKFQLFILRSKE